MALARDVAINTGMNSLRMQRRRFRTGSYGARYGASEPVPRPSLQPQEVTQATRRFQTGSLGDQYGASTSLVSPLVETEPIEIPEPPTDLYPPAPTQPSTLGNPLFGFGVDEEQYKQNVWDLLSPTARDALRQSGTNIQITQYRTKPGYNFYSNTLFLPPGMNIEGVQHELTHALLTQSPELAQNLPTAARLAHTPYVQGAGGLANELLGINVFNDIATRIQESAAISLGGANAYPKLTPSFSANQTQSWWNRNLFFGASAPAQNARWNTYR